MGKTEHSFFLGYFSPTKALLGAYLVSATGDTHVADDLLQEVAVVLWQKFDQYDEGRPFHLWALGIARLEVLRWRERVARSREVLSAETVGALADAAAEHAGELNDRLVHLERCVEQLPEKVRQVLRLRYWQVLPVQEIAERLGKSVAATGMILHRARRQLRECVERRLAKEGAGHP